MTRKQFVQHLGMLVFMLSGAAALLKTLSTPHLTTSNNTVRSGFGSGRYGG